MTLLFLFFDKVQFPDNEFSVILIFQGCDASVLLADRNENGTVECEAIRTGH